MIRNVVLERPANNPELKVSAQMKPSTHDPFFPSFNPQSNSSLSFSIHFEPSRIPAAPKDRAQRHQENQSCVREIEL